MFELLVMEIVIIKVFLFDSELNEMNFLVWFIVFRSVNKIKREIDKW